MSGQKDKQQIQKVKKTQIQKRKKYFNLFERTYVPTRPSKTSLNQYNTQDSNERP